MIRRREFLRASIVGAGALTFGSGFWRQALAAPATEGPGPYGALQPPDANGIMLPKGFTSREIARGGSPVPGTSFQWHVFSDGEATYRTEDGGFILVSNSENPPDLGLATDGTGGASAIRFASDGTITAAYPILRGTSVNCAGGATPWGTWLSCEEHEGGQVWECDPTGQKAAVARPAMGIFEHEAVCVDPGGQRVYLTEDNVEGGFYRFTPTSYPDLSTGVLEVAKVGDNGLVEWLKVPDPSAASGRPRDQVEGMTRFKRGEGIWFDTGTVYLCTTADNKIHAYDTSSGRIDVLYDGSRFEKPPLTNVDNVTVSRSGDLFVCEDTYNTDDPGLDIGIITPDREVARFLKVTGPQHEGAGFDARSELCGVVFDPAGDRMFFASQRGFGSGVIYEITGPFRPEAPRQIAPDDVGAHIPRRARIRTLLGRGFPFIVETTKPVTVTATLLADLPSQPGRARTTLARVSRKVDAAGRVKLHLRPRSRRTRARIGRERSFRATVTVLVTDAAGATRTFERTVRIQRRYASDRR